MKKTAMFNVMALSMILFVMAFVAIPVVNAESTKECCCNAWVSEGCGGTYSGGLWYNCWWASSAGASCPYGGGVVTLYTAIYASGWIPTAAVPNPFYGYDYGPHTGIDIMASALFWCPNCGYFYV